MKNKVVHIDHDEADALADFVAILRRPGWKLFVQECSRRSSAIREIVFRMFLQGRDEIGRSQAGIAEGLRLAIEVVPHELLATKRRAESRNENPEHSEKGY
jgi:hypothetical protein